MCVYWIVSQNRKLKRALILWHYDIALAVSDAAPAVVLYKREVWKQLNVELAVEEIEFFDPYSIVRDDMIRLIYVARYLTLRGAVRTACNVGGMAKLVDLYHVLIFLDHFCGVRVLWIEFFGYGAVILACQC